MTYLRTLACTAAAISVCVSIPTAATAQASGDGRLGPRTFTDTTLDDSLAAMNALLRARHAHDDLMASLSAAPEKDFKTTAVAVSDVPQYGDGTSVSGFTGSINGGSALDLHLAAFNDESRDKGESLFVQIARAAGGTDLDMKEAGGMPPVGGDILSFGPTVDSDGSLNENLNFLSDHIVDRADRENQLTGDGSVTGHSFELHSQALRVF